MLQRNLFQASQRAVRSPLRTRSPFVPISQRLHITRAPSSTRWYTEPAAKEGSGAPETKPDEQSSETAQLKEQAEKKDAEIIDLKDKYLRSVADFRNLQERTKREVQAAKDFALQRFARDLVESVDNLDRALTTVPKDKLSPENSDLVTLHDGLRMTENILMQTLKKHGLERFDPSVEGMKFDPNIHEAVFQTPQPDKEDGTVFHTQQKGFMLNGRVLRAAKVGVVKNS
ncbi:mitochondrial co-chaperone-like protein GrpE [Lindgomyces ingoldianus]|uniref:Mitochondrial co-chaperone-like protein GrpE n=1 Tax=Lindgomyces ingoldianus TaxID=673940 RepID=A0ACB6QWN1_9PLEO|nr:mitochondrial co-chaperone-like protein GrpE [Lindgomyces ingoldianus]KAF2470601.1 mitochondrial co-chaperone-like protein GrpE [Lindgomyces ingoldianus]